MNFDLVIIGGGIVGLWTAYLYNRQNPHHDIVLFESLGSLGDMATGRNSGVLHAGLYYPTGSLKHQLCLSGKKFWHDSPLNFKIKNCGKYVFACSGEEKQLEELYANAQENDVLGLSWCQDLSQIQKYTHATKAFFSSSTAIIDASGAVQILKDELYNKNIPLMLNEQVLSIGPKLEVKTNKNTIKTKKLINCAGAGALKLSNMLWKNPLKAKWTKGHYVSYNAPFFDQSLLYPLPHKDLKGLGVHTCLMPDGQILFGPDAKETETYDHSLPQDLVQQMTPSIQARFKEVDASKLAPAYAGIRFQLQGQQDFWLAGKQRTGVEGYAEALGIDSPGLTAAPAIASTLLELIS